MTPAEQGEEGAWWDLHCKRNLNSSNSDFRKPEYDAIDKYQAEVTRLKKELAELESQPGYAENQDGEEQNAKSPPMSIPPASSVSADDQESTAASKPHTERNA